MASSGADSLAPAGRRVIVTGARGGIGRATVALLEGCGCDVTGFDVQDFDVRDRSAEDIETNLSGTFNVIRAAFESLRESGDGRVVIVSSASAETGLPGQVAYTAAKAGLVGMARTLAAEWGRHGIRVNVVMPGLVGTPKVMALPEPVRDAMSAPLPLGRIADTAELAGTIAFLLSPAAAYITGAVIRVDGGYGLNTASLASGG
jgi:3-oxoacyl-[acyl-carrier protein] reductase